MLPNLNFYGNHSIGFDNKEIETVRYDIITSLRKIPVPDEIILLLYDSLSERFNEKDLSFFFDLNDWRLVMPFPDKESRLGAATRNHIAVIGVLGMPVWFNPHYIILPPLMTNRENWYSPRNAKLVKVIRSYYCSIVHQFGGDHALYIDERMFNKYYDRVRKTGGSRLKAFEEILTERYGINKKLIDAYKHGKYPKYYIDYFTDVTGE